MSYYKQQFDVTSTTKGSTKTYKVSERPDGAWECSCPNWTRNMPREDCKHILKIRLEQKPIANMYLLPLRPAAQAAPALPEVRTLETPKGRRFR